MADYQQHPLSAAFPAMEAVEFQDLKDSIGTVGVQNPIVLFEGMVIDGWHRYRASQSLGVDCPAANMPDDIDPRDFVLAQNKSRRSLNASQRSMAVAAVYEWRPVGSNQHQGGSAPGAHPLPSTEELASKAGVSPRTMAQAKRVESSGAPEIKEAVKSGKVSVKRAAEIAGLPEAERKAAIEAPAEKPKRAPVTERDLGGELDDLKDQLSELASQLQHAVEDNESMARILEANDQVAAALAEAKRFREENRVLRERVNGLMNEKNAAIRSAKSWQRKAEAIA